MIKDDHVSSEFSLRLRLDVADDGRLEIQFHYATRYTILSPLSATDVWLAVDNKSDRRVVLKRTTPEAIARVISLHGTPETIPAKCISLDPRRESRLMKILGPHPQIVQLLDTFETKKAHWSVHEFVSDGDLFQHITRREKHGLPEDQARKIFTQLLQVIEFAFDRGIVHLDLKPENLLLDSNGDLKVGDWGLAQVVCDRKSRTEQKHHQRNEEPGIWHMAGSWRYTSAERLAACFLDQECKKKRPIGQVALNTLYDVLSSEVYACGIILFEMLTAEQLYTFPTPTDSSFKAVVQEGKLKQRLEFRRKLEQVPPQALDLLSKILCPEAQRWSLDQIWTHPWFKSTQRSVPDR